MSERNWQEDWDICDKATPGPWGAYAWEVPSKDQYHIRQVYKGVGSFHPKEVATAWRGSRYPEMPTISDKEAEANAIFIATAREALPYWLLRVKELEDANFHIMVGESDQVERQLEKDLAMLETDEPSKARAILLYYIRRVLVADKRNQELVEENHQLKDLAKEVEVLLDQCVCKWEACGIAQELGGCPGIKTKNALEALKKEEENDKMEKS